MSTLQNSRVAFIGGGIMAEAFVRGIITQKLALPQELVVSEPLAARRDYLATDIGVQVTDSNTTAAAGADLLVLAVKPQVIVQVLGELAGHVRPETVVLSFVAGVKIATIQEALDNKEIVRIMPNTPGQIGEGISVWTATAEMSPSSLEKAKLVVGALGQEIYVRDEGYIDMATALNGSGPAYVFLFIEALCDAGVRMGFAQPVAEQLALQTVRGAAIYAQQSGLHPAILKNRVTSPGGTTAEALYVFEKGGLRALVSDAIMAAYEKAKSLGEVKKT